MQISVPIRNAIAALEKNLEEHIIELKEATEVWVERSIEALKEYRDAVTREGLEASCDKLIRLSYERPKDSRSKYSCFLGVLMQGLDANQVTVIVDEHDYDCIFNDNWDWRIASKTSNAAYKK